MKKTPLYVYHEKMGAKMAPFAGYEMPIFYTSIQNEHEAVRTKAGLFDVSHMGVIRVLGDGASEFLETICTNTIAYKPSGKVIYSVICREDGSSVDDILVYVRSDSDYFLVANASNVDSVMEHLLFYAGIYHVEIRKEESAILALQGPLTWTILKKVFPSLPMIKPMNFTSYFDEKRSWSLTVAATGYTGEKGVELFVPYSIALNVWEELLFQAKEEGLVPVGLGARDTLRLEMGYALYGHELKPDSLPTHSVASWAIKWDKPYFLGKQALLDAQGGFQYPVLFKEKGGIPREGCSVFYQDHLIGYVTSGTFSPTLKQSIAIIQTTQSLHPNDSVEIEVRHQRHRAFITTFPFIKKT